MKKRMLACLATGLFFVGIAGTAQAAGSDYGIDFCMEGPAYKNDHKDRQIVHTKLRRVDQEGSLHIEGMGISAIDKGTKTVVPVAGNSCDFCTEGFSDLELEKLKIIKTHNEIVPAAGI